MEHLTPDNITIITGLFGAVFGFITFVYKKVVKPILKLLNTHNNLVASIEVIKKEVVTNGGKSLKDAINSLKETCERIELSQKVIEQRSKLALHYYDEALFETDEKGNLVWTNEKFYKLTGENQTDLQGLNWIGYIQEPDREKIKRELINCTKDCRKFDIETVSTDGRSLKLIGFPYKIDTDKQLGFLFNLSFT